MTSDRPSLAYYSYSMGYSFLLVTREFYMHHPTNRIEHTWAFVILVVEHWLKREMAQWVHHEEPIERERFSLFFSCSSSCCS